MTSDMTTPAATMEQSLTIFILGNGTRYLWTNAMTTPSPGAISTFDFTSRNTPNPRMGQDRTHQNQFSK